MEDAWLITPRERGIPDTRLDDEHDEGTAWSNGNQCRPLIHGAVYFAALAQAVRGTRAGDLLCGAAERGVQVRGLGRRSQATGPDRCDVPPASDPRGDR